MTTPIFFKSRAIAGLAAAAGAALLCASGASAQSLSSYSFQVANLTDSNGSATFPVFDSVTFTNLKINEVFADSFQQTVSLPAVQTTDTRQTGSFASFAADGSAPIDPIHGLLTSVVLTGSLKFPGIPNPADHTLDLTLQPTSDPKLAVRVACQHQVLRRPVRPGHVRHRRRNIQPARQHGGRRG